ncbi:uncharacterized protein EI97DRAFT_458439 [Westerdykella ornata]|uniref:Uncharacterized protein n=1 Tax=Westerdykella ornata TaxID=318751 RepID=A0A6A6JJ67_WESOR|nr:uncharacterized protein EI97DRAFT_458439 [Westerdykella ornata]KAF2276517.1 hypothetical protein EI97DRAFT_458439 [Westerdykella ornata]
MPAICNNVAQWHAQNGLISPVNNPRTFHWDVGNHQTQNHLNNETPQNMRRARMCPPNWKGTYARPRCPEANRPQVVPPLWDDHGRPVTGLKWPTIIHVGAPAELSLMIEDGRDSQFVGALRPSGRTYSCDEFPPASWAEGGDGPNHQSPGTTYCAPIHATCDSTNNPADARGSEQNWQGFLHGRLGTMLHTKAVDDAKLLIGTENYNYDSAIEFYFRFDRSGANHPWAGRIYYDNGPVLDTINPGTPWRRSSVDEDIMGMSSSVSALLSSAEFQTANLTEYGFEAIEFIPDMTTGALTVKMPGGNEFAA